MNSSKTLLAFVISLLLGFGSAHAAQPDTTITVYKDQNCDCCTKWVDHLKANGFTVTIKETDDIAAIKQKFGIPADLQSCHTGTVSDYVIEGHVPADDIKKLLVLKPKAKGLAVPGMPAGSPGMEVGDRKDPYEVKLFTAEGHKTTFAKH